VQNVLLTQNQAISKTTVDAFDLIN